MIFPAFYLIGSFLLTFFVIISLIKISYKLNLFLDQNSKTHAIHKKSVPRNGGIAIYLSFLIFSYFLNEKLFLIVLSFLPAFIYSIYEDIKGTTPQKIRLLIMALSTLIAVLLSGIKVTTTGFFDIPEFLQIPFTVFAVVGIASAINFIDGLNGLASGVSIITILFFSFIFFKNGNFELFLASLSFASIIFAFFIVNITTGKIFLGDAGAYFLGYFIGMYSLLLINQYSITPWYPVALIGYPIIETLFTIYRRYKRKKKHPERDFFASEKVHLHTLIYKRIIRSSNSLSTLVILIAYSFLGFIATLFFENQLLLILLFFAEFSIYYLIYVNFFKFLDLKREKEHPLNKIKSAFN